MFFKRKKIDAPKTIPYKKLVVESQQAVYFEIPKVACTTINFLLIRKFIRIEEEFVVQQVHTDTELPRIWGELDDKYAHYFKFAFVRHPTTRIQSCFLDKIKPPGYYEPGEYENGLYVPFKKYGNSFWPGMNFDEFVLAVSKIPEIDADPHFRSQSCFIASAQNEIMVDFVGRFEQLEAELSRLFGRFNIAASSIKIPVVNKQKRPHAWPLGAHTKQLIHERYRRDFEIFAYDFNDR